MHKDSKRRDRRRRTGKKAKSRRSEFQEWTGWTDELLSYPWFAKIRVFQMKRRRLGFWKKQKIEKDRDFYYRYRRYLYKLTGDIDLQRLNHDLKRGIYQEV